MPDHDSPQVPGDADTSDGDTGGEAEARSRLAPARSAAVAGGASIPEAVWEDATRQLAGMLGGLATLQREVPALGTPLAGEPGQGDGG
jgi:hypothetical protein